MTEATKESIIKKQNTTVMIAGNADDEQGTLKFFPVNHSLNNPSVALFDREFYKLLAPLFGRKITEEHKVDGIKDGVQGTVYATSVGDKKIEHIILKEIADQLSTPLVGTPSLGRKGRDVLTAIVGLATEQWKERDDYYLWVGVSASKVLALIGDTENDGGKSYQIIDRVIRSLFQTQYVHTDKKKGKRGGTTIYGRYFTKLVDHTDAESGKRIYYIKLDEDIVRGALSFMRNPEYIKGSARGGQFTSYPLELLHAGDLSDYEKNGRDYLVQLQGFGRLTYPLKVMKLFREMGVRDDVLLRPAECTKILTDWLQKMKDLGLITDRVVTYKKGDAADVRKWKIQFLVPKKMRLNLPQL